MSEEDLRKAFESFGQMAVRNLFFTESMDRVGGRESLFVIGRSKERQ